MAGTPSSLPTRPRGRYALLTSDSANPDTLYHICLIAAGWWSVSATVTLLFLSLLRVEPVAKASHDGKTLDNTAGAPGGHGGKGGEKGGAIGSSGAGTLRAVLVAARRLARYKHASRFIVAQTLYLAAATADGANATVFAQEVVGLSVARITLFTVWAALAGAAGAVITLLLSRVLEERRLLILLMSIPPPLLLYRCARQRAASATPVTDVTDP